MGYNCIVSIVACDVKVKRVFADYGITRNGREADWAASTTKVPSKRSNYSQNTVKLDAVPQRHVFCVPILASSTCSTVLGFYCTGFHSISKFA